MELKSLTYTSWASPSVRTDDVDAILASARRNNPLQGISGLLIFNGSNFLQILEGVELAVDELVERLAADKRHSNMSIRDNRPIGGRTFPDWAMAHLRLEDGVFIGEEQVKRALQRDLPESLRNMVRGLVHNVMG